MFATVLTPSSRVERLERFQSSSERLALPENLNVHDLMIGADPFLHYDPVEKLYTMPWYREDIDVPGVEGMAFLRAPSVKELPYAFPELASFRSISSYNKETWAPEIHTFEGNTYLYIAESDGQNPTHRMHVYESNEVTGPYEYKGKMTTPDDCWAIDLTVFMIDDQLYGVWSGWPSPDCGFPQNLYIAKMDTPWSFSGERQLLAEPNLPWMRSVQPILEGPQAFSTYGFVQGLTFAADASWTGAYTTGILWYCGGDPLRAESWSLHSKPLFPKGHGLGHGMFIPGQAKPDFLTHRKTSLQDGWDDRVICTVSSNDMLLPMMYSHALFTR